MCSCVDVYQHVGVGGEAGMERTEEEEGGRVMMLREEKGGREGGRTVCSEVRERERGRERKEQGQGKKEKAAGKGKTGRTRQLPIDVGAFDSGARCSADTGRWSQ